MAKSNKGARKTAAKAHTIATIFSVLTLLLVAGFFAQSALEIAQSDILPVLMQRLAAS